jgi:uncharacterized membrane protein HdeD (DUF308 family)
VLGRSDFPVRLRIVIPKWLYGRSFKISLGILFLVLGIFAPLVSDKIKADSFGLLIGPLFIMMGIAQLLMSFDNKPR